MTGEDLRQLLLNKWGVSYDIQLRRTRGKIFLQIMWKYLEQLSAQTPNPKPQTPNPKFVSR